MNSLELSNMIDAVEKVIIKNRISIRFVRGGGNEISTSYPVPSEVFALFVIDELERKQLETDG